MKENRLGVLLGAFEDSDWRAYPKYAKSRYGSDSDCKLIIVYIKKHRTRYDPKKMDGEYLRMKVRPTAKPIVFANVMSQLCNHIESYFVHAEVNSDPMMTDTLLLKAFGRRGLVDQFHKQKKKAKVNRDDQPLGLWNNYHEFMGEYFTYFSNMTNSISDSKIVLDKAQVRLKAFETDLDGYLGVEMHNRTMVLHEDWIGRYTPLSKKVNELAPLDYIFFIIKKLKEHRGIDDYKNLELILSKERSSIEMRYTMITHMISFLNRKVGEGKVEFREILFDLNEMGLKQNFLFPTKRIPLMAFVNLINVACKLRKFEWARQFVIVYSKNVSSTNSKKIEIYGLASIYYNQQNYTAVIELLRDIKSKDVLLELRMKWLVLVSLCELNNDDYSTVKYFIDSYLSYIKRTRSKNTINGSNSFYNSTKLLKSILYKKDIELTIEILKTKKAIFARKWLLEKATEALV